MRYIEQIEIQNFRNLEHQRFEFFPQSVVMGSNGNGKSSTLDSLAIIFGESGNSHHIRNGAKKAVLSLKLSNGYTATKTITPKSVTLVVNDENGGEMRAPASVLSGLVAKGTFDCKDMMDHVSSENQSALADFILKRLPAQVEPEKVNEAVGEQVAVAPFSITQIRALEKAKYSERTRVNSDADEARKALQALECSVGEEDATDWGALRDAAVSEIAGIDAQLGTLRQELESDGNQRIAERRAKKDEVVSGLRARIAELQQEIAAAESGFQTYEQKIKTCIATQFNEESADLNTQKAEAIRRREESDAKAKAQEKARGVRELIPAQEARLQGHVTKATRLTTAIENLRELATSAIKNLGIPGLDIVDKDGEQAIMYDANDGNGLVRVDQLNGQKKAFLVADLLLRAQEASGSQCRALSIEGEGLVPSMLRALGEACAARQAQLIVAMPRETPLQVISLEEFLKREQVAA